MEGIINHTAATSQNGLMGTNVARWKWNFGVIKLA